MNNEDLKLEDTTISIELKSIIRFINKRIYSDRIYCFGKHHYEIQRESTFESDDKQSDEGNTHYYLLIISDLKASTGASLQDEINQRIDSNIEITIILHSLYKARKNIKRNNHFFYTIFNEAELVYIRDKKDLSLDDFTEHKVSNYIDREEHSDTNIDRALAFLKACKILSQGELNQSQMEVIMCLLSDAIEQACLALIYYNLGYKPNYFKIPHLINLCEHFWNDIDTYLPLKSSYEQVIFRMLHESRYETRHDVIQMIEEDDFKAMLKIGFHFIEMAEMYYLDNRKQEDNETPI